MKKTTLIVAGLLFSALLFSGCKGDDDKPTKPVGGGVSDQPSHPSANPIKTVTLDASDRVTHKWEYFSFKEGKVVKIENFQQSLDWDMAMFGVNVRLNCGASGNGKGGAIELDADQLEAVTAADIPTEGYHVDSIGPVILGPGQVESQPYNSEASKMATMSMPGGGGGHGGGGNPHGGGGNPHGITKQHPGVTLSGKVYAIRTAEGKVAKVQFVNWKSPKGGSFVYTVKYQYPVE